MEAILLVAYTSPRDRYVVLHGRGDDSSIFSRPLRNDSTLVTPYVRPLARAFFWTPGFAACWSAVVRAAMRVHMCGRCGGAAGLAGFVVGSAFVCVRSGAAPVWSAQCEVWSRDVFVSSSELVIEYYNMSIRSIKIFAHSYHLADALAPLWHKSRQPMGSQASTRPRTSRCATRWRR